MSIPVKNPVPEVNTSANIALSQWNDSVEKKELLSLDSFIDSIILNGAGTDVDLIWMYSDSRSDKIVYKLDDASDVLLKVRLGSNTPDDIPELGIGSNYDITGISGTGLVWDIEVTDISVPVIFGLVFTITLTEDTTENYTGSDGSSIPKVRYIRNIDSETFCKDWNVLFPTNFESCTIDNREYKRIVTSDHSDAAYLNVYVNGLDKSEEVGNTVRIFLPTFIGRYTNEEGLFYTRKFLAGATNSANRYFWQVPYARKSTVGSAAYSNDEDNKEVNEDKVLIRGETEVDNAKNVNLVNGELYSYKEMDFQDEWRASQNGETVSNYISHFNDIFIEYNSSTQTVTKYPRFRLEIVDSKGNKKVYYSDERGNFNDYEKDFPVGDLSYSGMRYTVNLYAEIIEENGNEILNYNPFFEGDVVCKLYVPTARLNDQELRVDRLKIGSEEGTNSKLDVFGDIDVNGDINVTETKSVITKKITLPSETTTPQEESSPITVTSELTYQNSSFVNKLKIGTTGTVDPDLEIAGSISAGGNFTTNNGSFGTQTGGFSTLSGDIVTLMGRMMSPEAIFNHLQVGFSSTGMLKFGFFWTTSQPTSKTDNVWYYSFPDETPQSSTVNLTTMLSSLNALRTNKRCFVLLPNLVDSVLKLYIPSASLPDPDNNPLSCYYFGIVLAI